MKKMTLGLILLSTVLFNCNGCSNDDPSLDTGSGNGTEEINGNSKAVKGLCFSDNEAVWLVFSSENITSLDKEPDSYTSIDILLSQMGLAQNVIDNGNMDLRIRCNGKYYDSNDGGFESGTLSVIQDGKKYTVALTARFSDGTTYKLNYSGEPGIIEEDPRNNNSDDDGYENNAYSLDGAKKTISSAAMFSNSSYLRLIVFPYAVTDYFTKPTEYVSIEVSPYMYDKDLDFSSEGIFFEVYSGSATYNVSNKNIKSGRIYFNKTNNVYTFKFNVTISEGRTLIGKYYGTPGYVYSTDPIISQISSTSGNNEGTSEILW